MDDGVAWSAELDFVSRLAEWDAEKDQGWLLLASERDALATLNIPYFTAHSDGAEIVASGFRLQLHGTLSGLERARRRLEVLDSKTIHYQKELIYYHVSPSTPQKRRSDLLCAKDEENVVCDGELFLYASEAIASKIMEQSIKRDKGSAWIGLGWIEDHDICQLRPLGYDLYGGSLGVSVYLAAHAKVSGQNEYAELAYGGIASLRRKLCGRSAGRFARSMGIGGAVGLGSVVYGLTVLSDLLNDVDLLIHAIRAAELITDELIREDRQLDVVGGTAGAILGLLCLHRKIESDFVLRRALRCGEHLLSQPRLGSDGARTWISHNWGAVPLTGMSHGAAGFALALASLGKVTARPDFEAAASECVSYEESVYMTREDDWPDLRDGDRSVRPCQWCHGGSGIGLARLGILRCSSPRVDLAKDIDRAIERVRLNWPGTLDTLCCGTLGGIEMLREAGEVRGRPDLKKLASDRLYDVVKRGSANGYRLGPGGQQLNLGLFRGAAGVGYACLREVDSMLPNVLIWS